MPKKYKTVSLYNVRIGREKLNKIKVIALKNDMTLTQFLDSLIDRAIRYYSKP